MKNFYSIICILLFTAQNLNSKDINVNELPQPLGDTGWRWIYNFSPIPSRQDSGYSNDIKLYISSSEEEDVTVKIEGKGFELTKKSIPNDFIEFSIPASIGQVYLKNDEDKPLTDTIFTNSAIEIISKVHYICYCSVGGQKASAGFLPLVVQQLGKNYILSSHPDYSNNETEYFPGEATITAAYDKTKVNIIKKLTDIPDTTKYLMNSGDVLLLSSTGYGDDLTGTLVEATKPVAVVSGNYCAFIPETSNYCDMIAEFEIPTSSWGKEYYVPYLHDRKKNPIIKILAKEDSTNIFRDNEYIGTILTCGGKEGTGFLQIRSDTEAPRPVVISGDKPINVTMFNPSPDEDSTTSFPAQLSIKSEELFTREILFIKTGSQFTPWDDLLLIYEGNELGEFPEEMQFAQVVDGEYEWMSLKELSPKSGTPFNNYNGKNFYLKQILLPGDGVFKVRSHEPFAAYIYNNESYNTQLFSASYSYGDLTIVDSLSPIPEWEMSCCGDVTGTLQDIGDSDNRSNLSTIYMHSDVSYNYRLIHDGFDPCEDSIATWRLEGLDCNEDAFATITFADCAGNDTTIEIHYYAPDIEFSSEKIEFQDIKVDSIYEKRIWLYNRSENSKPSITNLELKNNSNGFSIFDTNNKQITIPLVIENLDSLPLILRFYTDDIGRYMDTILVKDTCNNIIARVYLDAYPGGTGVIDEFVSDNISIIPNPASDNLTMIKDKPISDIKIFDILGCERQCQVTIGEERSLVNTSELSNGIYFLKISVEEKIITKKFIVRR